VGLRFHVSLVWIVGPGLTIVLTAQEAPMFQSALLIR